MIPKNANEKTRVSADMALKLSLSFETTPDFWLNAQQAVDLWTSSKKHYKISSTKTASSPKKSENIKKREEFFTIY